MSNYTYSMSYVDSVPEYGWGNPMYKLTVKVPDCSPDKLTSNDVNNILKGITHPCTFWWKGKPLFKHRIYNPREGVDYGN